MVVLLASVWTGVELTTVWTGVELTTGLLLVEAEVSWAGGMTLAEVDALTTSSGVDVALVGTKTVVVSKLPGDCRRSGVKASTEETSGPVWVTFWVIVELSSDASQVVVSSMAVVTFGDPAKSGTVVFFMSVD